MRLLDSVFKNRYGHIRAGWRILSYLVLFILLSELIISVVDTYLQIKGDDLHDYELLINRFINKSLRLLTVLLSAVFLLRWIDKRPIGLLGIAFYKGMLKELSIGTIIGLFLGISGILITQLLGLGSLTLNPIDLNLIIYLVAVLIILIISAIYEEILFRGYIFQSLIEGTNIIITLVFVSLLFGAAHLDNEDVTVFYILFTICAGIFLGVMYYRTRALWMCIGTHFIWNWTIGPIFGMGIEQNPFLRRSLFNYQAIEGNMNNGINGLEDLIHSIIFIILTIVVWKSNWFKPAEYNSKRWAQYPLKYGVSPENKG